MRLGTYRLGSTVGYSRLIISRLNRFQGQTDSPTARAPSHTYGTAGWLELILFVLSLPMLNSQGSGIRSSMGSWKAVSGLRRRIKACRAKLLSKVLRRTRLSPHVHVCTLC